MNFEEMKTIWDSQNNEMLYGINEKALHRLIRSKKLQAYHITNTSEVLWIVGNFAVGCLILGVNGLKGEGNIFGYMLSIWMLGTAFYMAVSRIRRIRGNKKFDRTVRGDLEQAISVANYQERLSIFGRWSILPIGLLTTLSIWNNGKSLWVIASVLIFIVLVYYAAGWEHRLYKNRKRELESLKNKLENAG